MHKQMREVSRKAFGFADPKQNQKLHMESLPQFDPYKSEFDETPYH